MLVRVSVDADVNQVDFTLGACGQGNATAGICVRISCDVYQPW